MRPDNIPWGHTGIHDVWDELRELRVTKDSQMIEQAEFEDRYLKIYQNGDVIFEQGSVGEELFVVIQGQVDISQKNGNGYRILTTLAKGEIFGEIALAARIRRTARATAAQNDTRLIVVDQARFVYLVSQQPVFALTIMRVLCDRIRCLEQQVCTLRDWRET